MSGSFNQIVSAAENTAPETVMAEAIREIDEAMDDVRAELGKATAQKHNANQRLASENNRHEDLNGKIRLALDEDREDLAEAAAASQLDLEAQLPIIEKTIADATDREQELKSYLQALQGRKRDMEQDLARVTETIAERDGKGDGAVTTDNDGGAVNRRVENASNTFERVSRSVTGVPAAATEADPAKLAELDELQRRERIKERLETFRDAK